MWGRWRVSGWDWFLCEVSSAGNLLSFYCQSAKAIAVKEIRSKFWFLNFTYKTSTLRRHIGKLRPLGFLSSAVPASSVSVGSDVLRFPELIGHYPGFATLSVLPSFLEGSWQQLCLTSISWPKSRITMLKFVVSLLRQTPEFIALTSTRSFWIKKGCARSHCRPPLSENQNHSFSHRVWESLVFSFRTLNLPGTRKPTFFKVISNCLSKMNGDLAFKRAKCRYMYESVWLFAKYLTFFEI